MSALKSQAENQIKIRKWKKKVLKLDVIGLQSFTTSEGCANKVGTLSKGL